MEAGESPTLAELAAAAAMLEFHFHRVFRLMIGETVGQAVQRVRLARSVGALAAGEAITAPAGAAGYSTSQAYAKALRSRCGTSATEARSRAGLDELAARFRNPATGKESKLLTLEVVGVAPRRPE